MKIGDAVTAVSEVVESDFLGCDTGDYVHARAGERGVVEGEIEDDGETFFMVRWTRTGSASQHLRRELRVEAKRAETRVSHPMAGFHRAG